jgi:hypothetical protein
MDLIETSSTSGAMLMNDRPHVYAAGFASHDRITRDGILPPGLLPTVKLNQ